MDFSTLIAKLVKNGKMAHNLAPKKSSSSSSSPGKGQCCSKLNEAKRDTFCSDNWFSFGRMNNACASWCDDDESMNTMDWISTILWDRVENRSNEKENIEWKKERENLDKFWWQRDPCTFGFYWVEYLKMVFAHSVCQWLLVAHFGNYRGWLSE